MRINKAIKSNGAVNEKPPNISNFKVKSRFILANKASFFCEIFNEKKFDGFCPDLVLFISFVLNIIHIFTNFIKKTKNP